MKFCFIFLILLIFSCRKSNDINKIPYLSPIKNLNNSLAIVFTNNLEGYVEPCGCNSNPLGGLARFSSVFSNIQRLTRGQVYFFDGGNLLFEHETQNPADDCQNEAKINLLLKSITYLGLDFTTPGALDKVKGEEYYQNIYKKHNIKYDQIKTIRKNDVTISIVGVNESTNIKTFKENIKNLKSLQKKHILILVSQLSWPKTKEVFGDYADINIIIQANSRDFVPKAPLTLGTNRPLIFFGGRQGQYFTSLFFNNLEKLGNGPLLLDDRSFIREAKKELLASRVKSLTEQAERAVLEKKAFLKKRLEIANQEIISLEEEEKIEKPLPNPNVLFFVIPLSRHIESDKNIKKDVDEYQKNIPALVKKCEANIICPKAPGPNESTFVGVETCKNCHQQAYEVWQKAVYTMDAIDENGRKIKRQVGHSKAWKTLTDMNKESDRSCIGCHSIGFMEKGGYCKASEVDFRINVQCESCHGPGSLHAKSGKKEFIKRSVTESDCRSCHHMPHIESYESFNYEEKLRQILGPGHGEKLLLKLKHEKN